MAENSLIANILLPDIEITTVVREGRARGLQRENPTALYIIRYKVNVAVGDGESVAAAGEAECAVEGCIDADEGGDAKYFSI